MRLSQFVRILWVHRNMCSVIFVAMLALAVAASVFLPKRYTGESAVVVDERGIDPLAQQGAMPVQLAAFVLTVIKGQLNVPFAPNKLGPFTPLHCAFVNWKLHTLNTVNTSV